MDFTNYFKYDSLDDTQEIKINYFKVVNTFANLFFIVYNVLFFLLSLILDPVYVVYQTMLAFFICPFLIIYYIVTLIIKAIKIKDFSQFAVVFTNLLLSSLNYLHVIYIVASGLSQFD